MNKEYTIEKNKYKLIQDYKNAFSLDKVEEKWTEYFNDYDYVVGDYAYDKLRLKGFCNKENQRHNKINDKNNIETYIKEDCAYECRYFVLEKCK